MAVSSQKRSLSPALALFAACGLAASAASAVDIFWNNAAGGAWNLGGNWLPNTVPTNAGDHAVIDLAGTYNVNFTASTNFGTLSILNPSASVRINGAVNVNMLGAQVVNNGSFVINPTSSGSATTLTLVGPPQAEFSGSGQLVLNASSALSTAQITNNAGQTLVNAAGHTIRGTGQILAGLTNNGLLSADSSGNNFTLSSAPKTNNSVMQATNNGTLRIQTTFTQSAAGQVLADGGEVAYSGTTFSGGTLGAASGGLHTIEGTSTFGNITNNAPLRVNNAITANLSGSEVENNGTLTINTTSGGSATTLQLVGPPTTTFSGTGQIVLNASGTLSTAQITNNAGQTLVNSAGHTIRGTGQVLAAMTNNGLVSSDINGRAILLSSGTKTNNATMQAAGGGVLQLSTIINQSPGAQILAAAGEVQLSGATVTGGSLNASGGGGHLVTSGSTLGSLTINAGLSINNAVTLNISGDSIVNNGTLTVNRTGAGSATTLLLVGPPTTTFSGNGQIALNASSALSTAQISANAGQTLALTLNQGIRGSGQIIAALSNDGYVSSDLDGKILLLTSQIKTNNGRFDANGGGILQITTTVNQTATGEIEAADASEVRLQGATINGGSLLSQGDGFFSVVASSTFGMLNNNAPVYVSSGSTALNIAGGGMVNNNTIRLNNGSSGSASILQVTGPAAEFSGTGEIFLNASASVGTAYITSNAGQTLTNAAGHTIRGTGQIYSTIVNNGLVSADMSGRTLQLLSQSKTNNSTMRAINGGTLAISGITLNQSAAGQILAGDASEVQLSGATINGGTLNSTGSGSFLVNGSSSLGMLTNNAPMQVNSGGVTISLSGGGLVNNGVIIFNNGVSGSASLLQNVGPAATFTGSGAVILNASTSLGTAYITSNAGQTITNAGNHTLGGRGLILSRIDNSGIIAPGAFGGGVGIIEMANVLTLTEDSRVHMEIGGDTAALYDRVTSNSPLNIDGTLIVSYRPSFTPTRDQSYTIMQGSVRNGEFFDVQMPPISGGVGLRLRYTSNAVIIDAICYADVNEDGGIDGADVEAFFDLWEAGDPIADLNNDGGIDGADVEFFFEVWENGGC